MGAIVQLWRFMGEACDFAILFEPMAVTGSVSGKGLDSMIKALI
jgi:hypothetical protein